jgi:hypothetical protein
MPQSATLFHMPGSVQFLRTPHRSAWRRLARTLLLPLLLVLSQPAALLHELSHITGQAAQQEREQPHGTGPCMLCMAFAQLDAAASPAVAALPLLAGLAFALVAVATVATRSAQRPALHIRGPPAHL